MITVNIPSFSTPCEEQLYTGAIPTSKRVSSSEAHKLRNGLYRITLPGHASIAGLVSNKSVYHELSLRNWEYEEVTAELVVPYNNQRRQRLTSTPRRERAALLGGVF